MIVLMKKQKLYNVSSLARKLGVHRQTVIYWIKKEWIKPRRDYRNYPVFTDEDVKKIINWKKTIN